MSIISPLLVDARVLDLFAGSGALGIEALSRGAAHVDLVEKAPASLKAIADNLNGFGIGDSARVHCIDAMKFIQALEAHSYDVAFADPPYDLELAAKVAEHWLAVPFAAVLGVEHKWFQKMPAGGEQRRYGGTAITFYRA